MRRTHDVASVCRSRAPTAFEAAALFVATALIGFAASSPTTAAAPPNDPLRSGLEGVFGPVSFDVVEGGPPHNGHEPAEWANLSGARSGDRGILYRTDQSGCTTPSPSCASPSTWIWDPSGSWQEIPGAVQPGGRLAASSAAVAGAGPGQAWIYSGSDYQGAPYDADSYILGADDQWAPAPCNPSCAVGMIDGASAAASPSDSLLFGGQYAGTLPPPPWYQDGESNAVFRWTGDDWEELAVAGTPPPPRAAAGFTFDGEDFIVFGGGFDEGAGVGDYADTWRLSKGPSGTWSWQKVCDQCGPVGRHQSTMAGLYMPGDDRHGAVLIGGESFNTNGRWNPNENSDLEYALSDVWAWNGGTWTQVRPIGTPCNSDRPDPCWADPAVAFAPFSASMPAAGAVVWTTGSCHSFHATNATQTCTRRTEQVQLAALNPTSSPAPTSAPTSAPAQAVAAVPRFVA